MIRFSRPISQFLERLRWPLALLSLLTLPASVSVLWSKLSLLPFAGNSSLRFLLGLISYLILWRYFFRRRMFGSLLSTFFHELAHALVAWITCNRVEGLKLTWSNGGAVTIVGHPHWLITLAPYFIPTMSLSLLIIVSCTEWYISHPIFSLFWLDIIWGMSLGFFWASLWLDLRAGQSDIQKAGKVFSACFLPSAICLSSAAVISVGVQSRWGAFPAFTRLFAEWYSEVARFLV